MEKIWVVFFAVLLTVALMAWMTACMAKSNTGGAIIKAVKGAIFVDLWELETDTPPHMVNNIIMAPVQALLEAIGYKVTWIAKDQQIKASEPSVQHATIIMAIGNPIAHYNKYAAEIDDRVPYEVKMESPPVLINGKMFAPLSFIAEAISYTVDYDVTTNDIYMFSPYYMESCIGEGRGRSQPVTESEMSIF